MKKKKHLFDTVWLVEYEHHTLEMAIGQNTKAKKIGQKKNPDAEGGVQERRGKWKEKTMLNIGSTLIPNVMYHINE